MVKDQDAFTGRRGKGFSMVRAIGATISLLVLAGCGGQHSLASGAVSTPLTVYTLPQERSEVAATIAIRYPTIIDNATRSQLVGFIDEHSVIDNQEAPPALYTMEQLNKLAFDCGDQPYLCQKANMAAEKLVARTTYYAYELRDYLQQRLNGAKVILWPQRLTFRNGAATMEPLWAPPPTLVVVDFFVRESSVPGHGSFGGSFTPQYTITIPAASSKTGNGVVVEAPLLRGQLTGQTPMAGSSAPNGYNYLDVINNRVFDGTFSNTFDLNAGMLSRPITVSNRYQTWPGYSRVSLDDVNAYAAGDATKSPAIQHFAILAGLISDTLANMDIPKALGAEYTRYANIYANSRKVPDRALLSKLAELELRYLDKRQTSERDTIYEGSFGNAIRASLKAEQEMVSDIDDRHTQSLITGILAVAAAGATVGMAASGNQYATQNGGAIIASLDTLASGVIAGGAQANTEEYLAFSKNFGEQGDVVIAEFPKIETDSGALRVSRTFAEFRASLSDALIR